MAILLNFTFKQRRLDKKPTQSLFRIARIKLLKKFLKNLFSGYFDRKSARDVYANLRNEAIRRREERRFEDMERLLKIRGPKPFNDDDIEDAPHMPWKK